MLLYTVHKSAFSWLVGWLVYVTAGIVSYVLVIVFDMREIDLVMGSGVVGGES